MQQRKVVPLEVVEPEKALVEMKDAMVTNMLSALQSLKSDSDGDQEKEDERRRNRKERRRQRRSRRSARESSIISSSSDRNSDVEQNQPTSGDIARIQCKQVVASFYPAK